MINNKEKKMIQRYCIYPKIAVVALIFSFVQCALIVPLEMIDDLVFQNKGFQPTGMFTALGFVIIYGRCQIQVFLIQNFPGENYFFNPLLIDDSSYIAERSIYPPLSAL